VPWLWYSLWMERHDILAGLWFLCWGWIAGIRRCRHRGRFCEWTGGGAWLLVLTRGFCLYLRGETGAGFRQTALGSQHDEESNANPVRPYATAIFVSFLFLGSGLGDVKLAGQSGAFAILMIRPFALDGFALRRGLGRALHGGNNAISLRRGGGADQAAGACWPAR